MRPWEGRCLFLALAEEAERSSLMDEGSLLPQRMSDLRGSGEGCLLLWCVRAQSPYSSACAWLFSACNESKNADKGEGPTDGDSMNVLACNSNLFGCEQSISVLRCACSPQTTVSSTAEFCVCCFSCTPPQTTAPRTADVYHQRLQMHGGGPALFSIVRIM